MSLTEKEKAGLEIEFIDKSKEVDKFDYDLKSKYYLALLAIFFPIFLKIVDILSEGKNISEIPQLLFYPAIILALIIILWPWIALNPISKEFKKKRKMERKRYRILGVNPADLDEELRDG